jgi:hypothetical protein
LLHVLFADGSTQAVPGRVGRAHAIPEQVQLSVIRNDQPVERVGFFPDGTSQATSLLISDAMSPRYQIAVDGSTGQVTVKPARPAAS